jgi:hypothetical protein
MKTAVAVPTLSQWHMNVKPGPPVAPNQRESKRGNEKQSFQNMRFQVDLANDNEIQNLKSQIQNRNPSFGAELSLEPSKAFWQRV